MHNFVVWDVHHARPISSPLSYGQALLIADEKELRHNRAFMVVPNPCRLPATPSCPRTSVIQA
jgi:hypothetical protein